jgi:hypothetical protein
MYIFVYFVREETPAREMGVDPWFAQQKDRTEKNTSR